MMNNFVKMWPMKVLHRPNQPAVILIEHTIIQWEMPRLEKWSKCSTHKHRRDWRKQFQKEYRCSKRQIQNRKESTEQFPWVSDPTRPNPQSELIWDQERDKNQTRTRQRLRQKRRWKRQGWQDKSPSHTVRKSDSFIFINNIHCFQLEYSIYGALDPWLFTYLLCMHCMVSINNYGDKSMSTGSSSAGGK